MKDAVLQAPPCELGEEALDGIEPRARRRDKVEGPARMSGQPGPDLGLLVGRVIVEDDVDGLVSGHLGFDGVQEADELLMPVPLHVAADHGAIQDIERGEQGCGPVTLVVVRHGCPAPPLQRQARLGAVERLDLVRIPMMPPVYSDMIAPVVPG